MHMHKVNQFLDPPWGRSQGSHVKLGGCLSSTGKGFECFGSLLLLVLDLYCPDGQNAGACRSLLLGFMLVLLVAATNPNGQLLCRLSDDGF